MWRCIALSSSVSSVLANHPALRTTGYTTETARAYTQKRGLNEHLFANHNDRIHDKASYTLHAVHILWVALNTITRQGHCPAFVERLGPHIVLHVVPGVQKEKLIVAPDTFARITCNPHPSDRTVIRRRRTLQAGTVRPLSSPVSVGSAFIYTVYPHIRTSETHLLLLAHLTRTTDGGLEHSNRENPQWEVLQTSTLCSSESLHFSRSMPPHITIAALEASQHLQCGSVSFPSAVPIQVPTAHLTPKINISC